MSLSRIEIITSQNKFNGLMECLNHFGISGMTVSNVLGFGSQKGTMEFELKTRAEAQLLPKNLITLFVETSELEELLELIKKELYSGHIGDGKIFVSDVKHVIRVRTGEEDDKALN